MEEGAQQRHGHFVISEETNITQDDMIRREMSLKKNKVQDGDLRSP